MPDSTTVRAERDAKYYRRFWIMAIATFGYGLYFLYDGLIGYPAKIEEQNLKIEKLEAFDTFIKREQEGEKNITEKWTAFAKEKGWPITRPEDFTEEERSHMLTQGSINGQFFFAGLCGLIAAWLLIYIARSRGRWIEGDGKSITSSWGQTVPFDQVTQLDKKKWKNKGIAKVQYTDSSKKKTFVIDDFKFLREPTGDILRQLEGSIDHGKIVNGKPEPPKQAKDEAEESPASAEAKEDTPQESASKS